MHPMRVIIADDESIIRLDLRKTLEAGGHTVVGEAGDGETALNLARTLKPDIAILDIKMPVMDGLDAAKAITEEGIAPVVLLTAYSEPELIARAKEAGVFGYLVKPFQEADLHPAMEVACARFEQMKALQEQVQDLEDRLETRKAVERAKGILMEKHGLTETEAFRRIQTQSMNTRKSMREIAEAIILASQI
ncbi:MAG: Fis family transcriptional regulator [Armatimonadota bacterium]|nr:MAG: Fis family transcriptional regulator [Armatimonadota bacterium]